MSSVKRKPVAGPIRDTSQALDQAAAAVASAAADWGGLADDLRAAA